MKGSSATLGLTKVKEACERIQHCKEDLADKKDESERKKEIDGIKKTLKDVQVHYKEVAHLLRRFFGEDLPAEPPAPAEEKPKTESPKAESPKAEKK